MKQSIATEVSMQCRGSHADLCARRWTTWCAGARATPLLLTASKQEQARAREGERERERELWGLGDQVQTGELSCSNSRMRPLNRTDARLCGVGLRARAVTPSHPQQASKQARERERERESERRGGRSGGCSTAYLVYKAGRVELDWQKGTGATRSC